MKSTKRLLLMALLFCVAVGAGNLFAQNRNDLLLVQDLENPNASILLNPSLDLHAAWRSKGVLQVRTQQEGDAPGTFRKLIDLDAVGNVQRKQLEGETWSLQYGKDGNVRRLDKFNNGKLASSQFFYYDRSGLALRKSVISWPNEQREVEGYFDAKGYLTRVRHSSKGIATKSVNITRTWNEAGQLTAFRSPDLSASYLYAGDKLIQCRTQEIGKNTQVNLAYGEFGLSEMKKYEEKDGDLILIETTSMEYNAAGLLARKTLKPRDPNAKVVVTNFFYDAFAPNSTAMRGDDWDGGGYGYGTAVVITWADPDKDARVIDSIYPLRLDLRPGVGQKMPTIKGIKLRLNNEQTDREIGAALLQKQGVADKYYVEEKLPLMEGANSIRLDIETDLGKFSSGERFVMYKNPNREITVRNLHVLAIGVADYQEDNFDLAHANTDVNELATALGAQKGKLFGEVKTKILTDKEATKANIEEAVRQIKGKAAKDDLVLIYFAGHGEERDGSFYLKPTDVKGNASDLAATAIDNRWILEEISRYNAPTLYFLDASHPLQAEGMDVGQANMDQVTADFESVVTNDDDIRIFMSSTSAKQSSRQSTGTQKSLYLEAMLEGLQGKADEAGNNNGLVTVEELGTFVSDRVLGLSSWKQKPSQVKRGIGMVPIAKVK
jgi:hypothetical protein